MDLIDRISNKNISVGIVGLGYVGIPLSLGFANQGIKVIGFDVAINAAPEGKAGRKTQMILFGDATNARNAAAFGQLVFKP